MPPPNFLIHFIENEPWRGRSISESATSVHSTSLRRMSQVGCAAAAAASAAMAFATSGAWGGRVKGRRQTWGMCRLACGVAEGECGARLDRVAEPKAGPRRVVGAEEVDVAAGLGVVRLGGDAVVFGELVDEGALGARHRRHRLAALAAAEEGVERGLEVGDEGGLRARHREHLCRETAQSLRREGGGVALAFAEGVAEGAPPVGRRHLAHRRRRLRLAPRRRRRHLGLGRRGGGFGITTGARGAAACGSAGKFSTRDPSAARERPSHAVAPGAVGWASERAARSSSTMVGLPLCATAAGPPPPPSDGYSGLACCCCCCCCCARGVGIAAGGGRSPGPPPSGEPRRREESLEQLASGRTHPERTRARGVAGGRGARLRCARAYPLGDRRREATWDGGGARVSQGAGARRPGRAGGGASPSPSLARGRRGARARLSRLDRFLLHRALVFGEVLVERDALVARERAPRDREKLPVETRYDASAEPSTQSPAVQWASVGSGLHSNGG